MLFNHNKDKDVMATGKCVTLDDIYCKNILDTDPSSTLIK